MSAETEFEDEWFAELRENESGSHGMSRENVARVLAYRAAVEQREAKLRGALETVREALEPSTVVLSNEEISARIILAQDAARAALGPNPPAYVSAAEHEAVKAELAALRKHIDGAWGGLLEGLAEAEQWTTETLALAKALGLKMPNALAGGMGAKLHFYRDGGDRIDFTVNKMEVIENGHDVVEVRLWGVGKRERKRVARPDGFIEGRVESDGSLTIARPQSSPPGPQAPPRPPPGRRHG
jgi:hypothetical protein